MKEVEKKQTKSSESVSSWKEPIKFVCGIIIAPFVGAVVLSVFLFLVGVAIFFAAELLS